MPEPIKRRDRDRMTQERFAAWRRTLEQRRAVPAVLIGMTVDGPAAGTPVCLCDGVAPADLVAVLRSIADSCERQQAAPTEEGWL